MTKRTFLKAICGLVVAPIPILVAPTPPVVAPKWDAPPRARIGDDWRSAPCRVVGWSAYYDQQQYGEYMTVPVDATLDDLREHLRLLSEHADKTLVQLARKAL